MNRDMMFSKLQILSKLLLSVPHGLSDADLAEIAETTHGFVGADLAALCKEGNCSLTNTS